MFKSICISNHNYFFLGSIENAPLSLDSLKTFWILNNEYVIFFRIPICFGILYPFGLSQPTKLCFFLVIEAFLMVTVICTVLDHILSNSLMQRTKLYIASFITRYANSIFNYNKFVLKKFILILINEILETIYYFLIDRLTRE